MLEKPGYHALETRIARLAAEIVKAREFAAQAHGAARGEADSRVAELAHRHAVLLERWQGLVGEPPGIWPRVKAEFDLMADDLSSSVADFMTWAAAGQRITTKS